MAFFLADGEREGAAGRGAEGQRDFFPGAEIFGDAVAAYGFGVEPPVVADDGVGRLLHGPRQGVVLCLPRLQDAFPQGRVVVLSQPFRPQAVVHGADAVVSPHGLLEDGEHS